RDSTDNDDGSIVDDGAPAKPFDLEEEGERLEKRLRFLSTVARLWRIAARAAETSPAHSSILAGWLTTAPANLNKLPDLLDAVHAHPVPEPEGDYDSVVEYDRRRGLKEHLLTAALGACLDSTLAVAALEGYFAPDAADDEEESPSLALGAIKG